MTRRNVAIFGGAAVALALAGAASAANYLTSMGYVDGLQWQINHAADTGMINNYQRDQLLDLQRRTRDIAWRCDSANDQYACARTVRNVNYINRMIGRRGYGGYDNGYGRSYYDHRDDNGGYRDYDRDNGYRGGY